MKIAVIQGSSQKLKNTLLAECTVNAVKKQEHEVINFGVYENEDTEFSYIQIALLVSMLLSSRCVDFVVTGCSSGQGMMLACNALPNVQCGYVQNPSDAYLFGRINGGNAISFPLGLNFGWAGEINLQNTLNSLFDGPFGDGYPKADTARKRQDSEYLKMISSESKIPLHKLLMKLDESCKQAIFSRREVIDMILKHGSDQALIQLLMDYRAG